MNLSDLLGLFLAITGVCALVGAAAMVAVALGVAVFGLFALFGGMTVIYVGAARERAKVATAATPIRNAA